RPGPPNSLSIGVIGVDGTTLVEAPDPLVIPEGRRGDVVTVPAGRPAKQDVANPGVFDTGLSKTLSSRNKNLALVRAHAPSLNAKTGVLYPSVQERFGQSASNAHRERWKTAVTGMCRCN